MEAIDVTQLNNNIRHERACCFHDCICCSTTKQTNPHFFRNVFASGELRYYYNLNRRIRLGKTVRNFSAFYLSIEEQLISKPLLIINKTGNEVLNGRNSKFINIGYQYQNDKTYYNIYIGARFPGQVYNNTPTGVDLFHAGVTIGRVF